MPQIEIRPATAADSAALTNLEHFYQTPYVWQMERLTEEGQTSVAFREVRLPRMVRVEYPRPVDMDMGGQKVVLAAFLEGVGVGYVGLSENKAPTSAWVSDLVVGERHRRQGIGSALLLAAQEWASERRLRRMILEMQSKNYPAIRMATKLGYEFCGYHDHFYSNQDIALFFACYLR